MIRFIYMKIQTHGLITFSTRLRWRPLFLRNNCLNLEWDIMSFCRIYCLHSFSSLLPHISASVLFVFSYTFIVHAHQKNFVKRFYCISILLFSTPIFLTSSMRTTIGWQQECKNKKSFAHHKVDKTRERVSIIHLQVCNNLILLVIRQFTN